MPFSQVMPPSPSPTESKILFCTSASLLLSRLQGCCYHLSKFLYQFGTICCSTSGSKCCFLTCIQISQEADKVIWYSHLLKNFPQFVVIHTVKGFGIVNKAEISLEFWCFFYDPTDVGNLISGSSAFSFSFFSLLFFFFFF